MVATKKRLERMLEYATIELLDRPPKLKAISIEISSRCNRTCGFCPNSQTPRSEQVLMEEELFRKIIDDLASFGFAGAVNYTNYNEPLLDKRLPKLIEYTRTKLPKSHIYINTNGDALTLKLWKKLRSAGLNRANISQYDGSISRKMSAIANRLSKAEMQAFDVNIFDESTIRNRAGLIKTDTKLPVRRYCDRPFYQMVVTFQGKVTLCCNDYHGVVEIGDVRTRHVSALWKSEIFKRYRKKLLKKDRASLKLCDSCDS
jgi:MoaA/NifB/PqqE/SkfB family radical SAM enzyme